MNSEKTVFLVVEDFEDSRFMMRRLLEMAGYEVLEASDGEQAVKIAVDARPALILMDLSLPKLDGLSATREIRKQRVLRDVPIVAVSAHDSAQTRAEALAAGCNDYITKPIDFDILNSVLERYLNESPSRQSV
jgi:two-component system cell cycle response regulator DivK